MYTITMQGGTSPIPIYDPRDERLCVQSAVIEYEVNTAGTATLVIPYAHKNYSGIFALVTNKEPRIIEFYDDADCIFKGRITACERDFNHTATITITGLLYDLNNVISIPYDYSTPDIWANIEGITDSTNRVKWLFNHLVVDYYNDYTYNLLRNLENLYNYVPFAIDNTHFTVDNIAVINGQTKHKNIYRQSDEYNSPWAVAESDFFGSDLGGYLYPNYNYTVHNDNTNTDVPHIGVCYEKNFSQQSTQKIEFGKNLLDIVETTDRSEMITSVYPLGKYGSDINTLNNLTELEPPLPDYPNIIYYEKRLLNVDAVEYYGLYQDTYIVEDCADTEVQDILLPKACAFLAAQQPKRTINVTGFDLGLTNPQIAKIKPFTQVQVVSAPHGINDWFNLTKMTLDIINPQSTTIQLTSTTAE